jgi:hypothetical protein
MRPKYKLIVLVAAAAIAMAALISVNWQASQDRGPRRPAVSAPVVTPHAGTRVGVPGQDRWTVS